MAIHFTLKQVIAYCKRENKMQQRVYPNKIANKTMSKENANRYYQIIKQLGELAADMEESNIHWEELRTAVASKKGKRKTEQLNLFNE
jgi:hypothetical protein